MSLLSLNGVAKRYWRGPTLADVTLELMPGELACVLGERRSGKTTLLRIAAGIEMPDAGSVRVDGRDVRHLSERERTRLRRTTIGCVWQGSRAPLRGMSILDHVALPLLSDRRSRREARRRAIDRLERVGALDCIDALMHELSDADRTRVAIAQATVRAPRLLIADEPTDTLDLFERNHVLGLLRSFALDDGMTILITAADATGATGNNRLLSLGDGRLVEAAQRRSGDVIPFAPREAGKGRAS